MWPKKVKLYFWNIVLALDHLGSAFLGGSPDECISTRAYEHYPRLAKVIDFFLGKDHCKRSAEREDKELGLIN